MCADQKQHPIRVNSIIMKTNKHPVNHPAIWNGPIINLSWGLALLGLFAFCGTSHAANISKADNANNLNLTTSWVGSVVPGSGDVAVWDSTVTAARANTLGASMNWKGITISSVQGAPTVNANVYAAPFSTVTGSPTLTYSSAPANPLVNGDQAYIGATNVGFTVGPPATYYVVNATATTFQLSATPGGAAINATTTQASPMVLPTVTGGFLTLGASGIDTSASAYPLTVNCPVVSAAPQTWNLAANATVTNLLGANASGNDVTLNNYGFLYVGNLTLSNLVVDTGATVIPTAGGVGTIALNGGAFFMFQNATFNGPNVYVTPGTGGTIYAVHSRTWTGYLTGSGPLNVGLDGNFMQWGGTNSGYTGTITCFPWVAATTGGLRFNGPAAAPSSAAVVLDSGGLCYLTVNGAGIYSLGSLSGGDAAAPTTSYIGTASGSDYSIGGLNTSTTYSGNIWGAGRLIKTGAGTLTLDGTINGSTYTGSTVISNGVLQIGSGGGGSGLGLLGSGNVTNYSSLVFNVNGSQTFANVIAGIGSVTNIGSGKVTLTGAINYSGPSFITAGELAIGSASQLTNTIAVSDGATLGAVPAVLNATVTEGAVNFGSGSGCSYEFNLGSLANPASTVVTNTGNINLNGNVTVNVLGTNTSLTSGTITLLQYASRSGTGHFVLGSLPVNITGSLNDDTGNKRVTVTITVPPPNDMTRVWVGDSIGNWDIGNTGNKIWKVAGTGQITNYNDGNAVLFNDTATGTTNINLTTTLQPSAVTVNNTNKTYTFGGAGHLAGSTGLTKQGPGTLITTNANSYGGLTVIQSGTLAVAGNGASLGTGGVTNNGTLILDLSHAGASYTLPFQGQITGAGGVSILGMDQTDSQVQMNIADAIGLGTVGNPYSGGTTISNAYVLIVPNPDDATTESGGETTPLGTGTITFLGTSTLQLPNWGVLTDSAHAGIYSTPINVPTGQTGTLLTAGRMTVGGNLTGGGIFNLGVSSVRGEITCNFGAFTGQINVFPNGTADFRVENTNGFPLASLYLEANVTAYSQNVGSGAVFRVGEFSSDPASVIGEGTTATATGTPCTWQVGALNLNSTNAGNIGGGIGEVSLIKEGTGTWTLSGVASYSGNTTVSNGTLALTGGAAITNSPAISISSPGVLDVSGIGGTLSLGANGASQTLQGGGTINGSLVAGSLGTVTPGFPSSVGTLTVTNTVTLGGATFMKLNRAGLPNSDRIAAKSFTGGGTLSVTNIGAGLQAGDTFQLFSTNISGFATVNLQTNDPANYYAYTWTNRLAIDGTIRVLTAVQTVNTNRPIIGFTASGNTLTLSWPTNAGWTLEVQTNSSSTGLSTNWVVVPNSQNVTSTNITINPTNGSVFYRMVLP